MLVVCGVNFMSQYLIIQNCLSELLKEDPQCLNFPWKPKTPRELLAEITVLQKDNATNTIPGTEVLENKTIGLYFSANWCFVIVLKNVEFLAYNS